MKKMTFFQYILENYGLSRYDWEENYCSAYGQGKQLQEEYEAYMEDCNE